ncbi:Hypothetical predicted protein [Paramuricea clavata]|uniref:Uncharacterized protein n=1 Tax=Paramuricea clavata TaxID=317549 RepID=A0A6S7KZK5_PARCT|nr:Hypothetical predicted protein [Paramuricea clavata]
MSKINDKTDQIEGSHVAKDQEKSIPFVEIISTKCDKIAKAVDQLEDYSYQYNLKIVGIPQEQATETEEQTVNLCLNLFKTIGADDVISTDRPNAIICKFVRPLAREK